MNVSTKITKNKQYWKKKKMNIKVLQSKYSGFGLFYLFIFLSVCITEQEFADNVK